MERARPEVADPPPARPPLPLLFWLLLAWALARRFAFGVASAGFGTDVAEYFRAAHNLALGQAPYADYLLEYPPGALPLFVVPYLLGGREHFIKAFVAEMALFDLAALLLVYLLAQRLWPASKARQALASLAYVAATFFLHPVLYSRFDLAPAAMVLGALALAGTPAGAALLGLAGATKLWPLALAPLWLVAAFRASGPRRAALQAAALAAAFALPVIAILPRSGPAVLQVLRYHGARGLQVESTWATLAALFARDPRAVNEFGAIDLTCGAACEAMRALAGPAMLLLALLPAALAWRRGRELPPSLLLQAAGASIVGLLLGAHVLSPQFLIWVVPLLVLCGPAPALGAVVLAMLTSLLYPVLYAALLDPQAARRSTALAALALRNAGLLGLYLLLIVRLRRRTRSSSEATPL